MVEKTILLIGRTGRGKSTLANVLLNKNNNFEQVFKESFGSISETKKIQFKQFEENDANYLIIDTPGIGDTKMSDSEVLDIIAGAIYQVRNGLSQVLFVIDSRFDKYEMATYNLLRTIIFDEKITNYTTVVRTNFANFRKKERREEDIRLMKEKTREKKIELEKQISNNEKRIETLLSDSEEYQKILVETEELKKELKSTLSEIIESCGSRVVHVDNPPSDKKLRENSRKKVLEHLQKTCREDYNPDKLKKLSEEIAEDMDNLIKSRNKLEEEMKKLKTSVVNSDVQSNNESVVEEKKESTNQEPITESDNLAVGESKTTEQLEEERDQLIKEIKEKERIVRQKILKHIFNSYKEINNELGGNIFISSVTGDHKWEEINKKFNNKELVVKWLSKEFDYQQVQKWAIALGNGFNPEKDSGFCAWLRDDKKLTVEKLKEPSQVFDINQLRDEYNCQLKKGNEILGQYNQQLCKKEVNIELKESEKKFELLIRVAESGDSFAQYKIGNHYLNGIGVEKDEARAFMWFKRSAESGNCDGQRNLGMCYEYGIGTEKNENEAYKWYLKSAEGGNANAISNIGYFYQQGIGITKDEKKAFAYFQKAADMGSADGVYNVGTHYRNGIGVEKDEHRAFIYYQRAAEMGHASGTYSTGYCYENELGVEKDEYKAFKYYKKSAEMGNDNGISKVGHFYRNGIGVKRDLQKANEWYQKAKLVKDNNNLGSSSNLSDDNIDLLSSVNESDLTLDNNMTEPNQNNTNQIESKQPNITVKDVNNKEGNTNLGNTMRDHANLSSDHSGATISGGSFDKGQHNFGGYGKNTWTDNYADNESRLLLELERVKNQRKQLVKKAENELEKNNNEEGEDLLDEILRDVRKYTKEGNDWRDSSELSKKVRSLGKQIKDKELIQDICQYQAKETKSEMEIEEVKSQKKLIAQQEYKAS